MKKIIFCVVALMSGPVFAQGAKKTSSQMKTFHVALPIINFSQDLTLHGEYNLYGEAAVALELSLKGETEDGDSEKLSQGLSSRRSKGSAVSLHIARYSENDRMGGFYWSLGAGYRQAEVVGWDKDPNLTLDSTADAYRAEMAGVTGHGRLGYRYVAQEFPFLIGAFLGVRHFSPDVKDKSGTPIPLDKDVPKVETETTPLTPGEMDRLKRLYASRPEGGLEIGFTF